MNGIALATRGKEAGGSAVSFILVLPILATLLCAIVDFGRFAFVGAQLQSATQAACQWACGQVSSGGGAQLDGEQALAAALDACPALNNSEFRIVVKPSCSAVSETGYQCRSFNAKSGEFDERDDSITSVEVSVSSTLEASSLTPVGLVAFSSQNAGTFCLSSYAVRTVYVAPGSHHG